MIYIYTILISFTFSQLELSKDSAYKALDGTLLNYISKDGNVDYMAILQNPYSINEYLDFIERVSPRNHPELFNTKNDAIAYWINTYNAIVIKILIDNPEVSSILDVTFKHAIFWKRHLVGGEMISLNMIEHKILRKEIQDPRIHFAINCGSVSCPPLGNRIFYGEKLDLQLNNKAYDFINNGIDVKIDSTHKIIYLNKIFKWYKKDFGNLYSYLCIYLDGIEDCNLIRDYKISYDRYNWDINRTNN